MARYEQASVEAYVSLAVLNAGQAVIFTLGLTAAMVMCAYGIRSGTNTVGDFVMINAMMIQLYQPLNFMGMVYREIKQAVTDIETMFAILARKPEIEDRPARSPCTCRTARSGSRMSASPMSRSGRSCKGLSFEVPGRPDRRHRGPVGRRQVDHLAAAVPVLRHHRRPHPDRRPGHPRRDPALAARGDRHGAAGHGAVQRHDPLQHPLRPLGRERRRGRGGRQDGADRRLHPPWRRKATRPKSASAA